jgi:hypothetical protein
MSETTSKSSLGRKIFVFAVLLLLFVVLPAGSYYYVKSGFEWRKEAQSELRDFGKIRGAYVVWQDGQKEDLLKGKVCVIHLFGQNPDLTPANKLILDTGEELVKQFGFKPGVEDDNFRLAMITEGGGTAEFKSHAQTRPTSELTNWVWTGGLGSWTTILKNGYEYYCQSERVAPYEKYYALTDTSGTIRRFYNAEDPKEVGRMVEQIALLMPVRK